eukprot:CAMPEP_0170560954 /NCGR_PEP_ID=MMETSP0211-20121228/51904_1 /TAXON_ID=311385 /ORGANISM="Pseudokeronopsis sp., Strain OXSARD2" /LENGTH=106 /DNA_ID=CAMNT_0010875841 /DNA_START=18 /DNA_END=338 /DNA_ORIENTATION=+
MKQLIKVNRVLQTKLEEIAFLEQFFQTGKTIPGIKNVFDPEEEEYTFESSDEENEKSKISLEKTTEEIKFNKIMQKIPDELKPYVSEITFRQFNDELKTYEKWKRE